LLNIVVPAECELRPLGPTHRLASVVGTNPRVNPHGDSRVRWSTVERDLPPRNAFIASAHVQHKRGDTRPFRVMVELACTPSPPSDSDRFRFALVGSRDAQDSEDETAP
jgi:hypothetical protein